MEANGGKRGLLTLGSRWSICDTVVGAYILAEQVTGRRYWHTRTTELAEQGFSAPRSPPRVLTLPAWVCSQSRDFVYPQPRLITESLPNSKRIHEPENALHLPCRPSEVSGVLSTKPSWFATLCFRSFREWPPCLLPWRRMVMAELLF